MPDSTIERAANREIIARSFPSSVTARDAVAHHYAVEHDLKRSALYVEVNPSNRKLEAWAAVCQTGMDLFRPLVVMRAENGDALQRVLRRALMPNRQYLVSAPVALHDDIILICSLHGEQVNMIHALDRAEFVPVVNILVQGNMTPDGKLRATIRARDGLPAAEAGTNWQGAKFAELFVQVQEGARLRGLGKSVLSAVCAQLFEMQRQPIYLAGSSNIASSRLAERVGFRDSGGRELTGAINLK